MIEILICIIAGMLAGIGTGFAGMSAASFITPVLVGFLDVPVYDAVGIALISDVLASALSTVIYKKAGNFDIRKAMPLMVGIVIFTILGSILAYKISVTDVGNSVLGYWSIIAALGLGIHFILHPVRKSRDVKRSHRGTGIGVVLLCSAYIGLICGFQGVGGGLMILFSLTVVMGYDFKIAVGTSVFIMTFTALIGGASHFLINGMPDVVMLITCCISTAVFAILAAHIANRHSERFLGLCIGWILTIFGVATLLLKIMNQGIL